MPIRLALSVLVLISAWPLRAARASRHRRRPAAAWPSGSGTRAHTSMPAAIRSSRSNDSNTTGNPGPDSVRKSARRTSRRHPRNSRSHAASRSSAGISPRRPCVNSMQASRRTRCGIHSCRSPSAPARSCSRKLRGKRRRSRSVHPATVPIPNPPTIGASEASCCRRVRLRRPARPPAAARDTSSRTAPAGRSASGSWRRTGRPSSPPPSDPRRSR